MKKFIYWVRKCGSYFGAMNFGLFVAVGIEYGWHFEVVGGLILSLALMFLMAYKNVYYEEEN